MKFQLGDKVDWLGAKGMVVETNLKNNGWYTVRVRFDYGYTDTFMHDGRFWPSQDPSLKIIKKAPTFPIKKKRHIKRKTSK